MAKSSWIIDVDAPSFATAVVERSKSLPVVLDFWATWCGPCQTLGPALEKLANEENGRFLLAKVDIDQNPEIAQAFRIQSVPTVIAIVDGRPVDAFQGALPEPELRAFLDRIAPAGGMGANPEAEARQLAEAGDVEGAVKLLRDHLRTSDDGETRILLAGYLVDLRRHEEAKLVLAKLSEEDAQTSAARAVQTRIAFAESAGDLDELRRGVEDNPQDAGAHLDLGQALVAAEDYESGLEHLLEAIRLDPTYADGAAKQKMLEVFDLLGLEDPVANDYRFKLSLELFA